jgi:flagellar hook-associated protein 3 FlgL
MRITSGMYYRNLYGTENSKLSNKLFDVNKQIASGLKIQYASDDVTTFTETMRLDNEMTTLEQIKKSTDNGYKMSDQTDTVMNEFNTSMNRMRTLLVQSANDTNSETSRDAIAKELRGLEDNLKSLANTSINGKYLFSGSATGTKPIDDHGVYQGNDDSLNAFVGSHNQQQYNISGSELFLGEEASVKKEMTTNVVNENLIDNTKLTVDSQIRDLMGDKNGVSPNNNFFYVRGTDTSGKSFNEKIVLSDTATIQNLLTEIEKLYSTSGGPSLVTASLNDSGQITIQDRIPGSSKLDFHMVGAIDYNIADGNNLADIDDAVYATSGEIDNLDGGETIYPPAGDLYVKEFVQSGLTPSAGAATNIEGLVYDRVEFTKDGSKLKSASPQVLKDGNAYAEPSTMLSEVADLSQGTSGSLDGTTFELKGTDISGASSYDITINLQSAGSSFTDNATGNVYNIYNMQTPRVAVDADEMTYQQLMDVVNMAITGSIPATSFANADEYDAAIKNADIKGDVSLSYDGRLEFTDFSPQDTQATLSLYDGNSGKFGGDSSAITFNSNNALTIRDPKTDFFKDIDEMIKAVENYTNNPNANSVDIRNVGIQGAIAKMDDLQDHVLRSHSTVGAQSNTLSKSAERVELLQITTMSLRSEVIDTDLAEASLSLAQLNTNYEAMLSTVGRISKLSLVNYL